MDRKSAELIAKLVLRYPPLIDVSIAQRADDSQYRRLAGTLLGYLFTNLLMPIYDQYPDLQPREFTTGEAQALSDDTAPEGEVKPLLLAIELANDLRRIHALIAVDDTILEKEHARADLAEIAAHLERFKKGVE
jgi:hypothetical protein